jgi:hypothetical protein
MLGLSERGPMSFGRFRFVLLLVALTLSTMPPDEISDSIFTRAIEARNRIAVAVQSLASEFSSAAGRS